MTLCFAVALLFRWRFQFSIRSLLVLTVAVALPGSWLGVEMKNAREQNEAADKLTKMNGYVLYDWQTNADDNSLTSAQPPGPKWLRNLLGSDFFASVVFVLCHDDYADAKLADLEITDAGLTHLAGLTQLHHLGLNNTRITDGGLAHLAGLTQLRWLRLDNTRIADGGLAHLAGLTQLEELDLSNTKITDAGLDRLGGLIRLRALYLESTRISDAGLANVAGWPQLQCLCLQGTQITDAGLARISGLTQLQVLRLDSTQITDAGLAKWSADQLQELDLNNTQITDAGLAHLAGLTQLQCMFLKANPQITDAGVNSLHKRLPNCDIRRRFDAQETGSYAVGLRGFTTREREPPPSTFVGIRRLPPSDHTVRTDPCGNRGVRPTVDVSDWASGLRGTHDAL